MKVFIYFNILLVFILFIVLISCKYDKADLLYSNSNFSCDTTGVVSYSAKVLPLLTAQCYSCHKTGAGGIVMGTYITDKFIATNGKLYTSVSHTSGISPMPKGAPKMTICQLTILKKWIEAGSPNN